MRTSRRQRRILLVEDNSINQFLTVTILKKMEVHVDIVSDGIEALAVLKKAHYDLVLMDCRMSGIDGCETARRIRNPEYGTLNLDVPLIAYTAYSMEEDMNACFASDMNDYIGKPFALKDFRAKVSIWLEKSAEPMIEAHRLLEIK